MKDLEKRLKGKKYYKPSWDFAVLKNWIDKHGGNLNLSNAIPCLERIIKGKSRCKCEKFHHGRIGHLCLPVASEHITMWLKDGKPYIYVSQPYISSRRLSKDMKKEKEKLLEFCNEHELDLKFCSSPESWYDPGKTVLIEVMKKGI